MPEEFLPEGFAPCVSSFYSPLQRRKLSEEAAGAARADGLQVTGSIATGFAEDGFSFPAPDTPAMGIIVNDATWGRGAKLKVHFMNGGMDIRNQVETYAKLWSAVAEVDFTFGVRKADSDIRVNFNGSGFHSRLGMEARQFPDETMSLAFRGTEPEAEVRRLVLHEFGHALGFMHEHQHPESGIDWDPVGAVRVYRPLLPPGLSDRDILAQLQALPDNSYRYKYFRFDPLSIMMYSIPPQAVRSGYRDEFRRNNTTLSDSDKVVIGSIYGARGTPPPAGPRELVLDGPPLADRIDSDGEVDLFFFTAPALGRYVISVMGDALVHVDVTDAGGNPPYSGDRGEDTTSPRVPLTMRRLLDPGRQNVRLTGGRFAAGFASGTYTIRVTRG